MTEGSSDLFVLVPDVDIESIIRGLLSRPKGLGIREIRHGIERNIRRDPGCRIEAADRARHIMPDYQHFMVVFDRHGCGRDESSREEIQAKVEEEIGAVFPADRFKAIVIDPEVEAWVWNRSPKVLEFLGWEGTYKSLRRKLQEKNLWEEGNSKPSDPKEALMWTRKGKSRSGSLFKRMATVVSLDHCADPAFNELRATLQRWFPRGRES